MGCEHMLRVISDATEDAKPGEFHNAVITMYW